MIISFRKKFLFVHVPKTAGSSILSALLPYRDIYSYREKLIDEAAKAIGLRIKRYEPLKRFASAYPGNRRHATLQELRQGFGPNLVDKLFKFAFVRNPYDLFVSAYFYSLQEENSRFHEIAKSAGDFDGYVRWRTKMHLVTQFDRLKDTDGKVGVDFVGRFEHVSEDFAQICKRIGVSASLPHENRSVKRASRSYASFYGARETQDLVLQTYGIDFDMFGYSRSLEEARVPHEVPSIAAAE